MVVRSAAEILATLDDNGELDNLPFMPEMLRFCGQRLRVSSRADKTCDTVHDSRIPRRMRSTVHLTGTRCDGTAHGGCHAGCLLYWKEAWLRPVAPEEPAPASTSSGAAVPDRMVSLLQRCTTRPSTDDDMRYMCQATELPRASSPMRWWYPAQYVRDFRSGHVSFRRMALVGWGAFLEMGRRRLDFVLLRLPKLLGRRLASRVQDWARRWKLYPQWEIHGRLTGRTPTGTLGLAPGEWVRVKPLEEIERTLDVQNRNRGLLFDTELAQLVGREFQTLHRVERIIDEETGKMLQMKSDCWVLDQAWCSAEVSKCRLFCSRQIYSYWREIWLERVSPAPRSS